MYRYHYHSRYGFNLGETKNLNTVQPASDDGTNPLPRADRAQSKDGTVEVYFDHLEERLIEHISRAEVVVGCVAWLTNFRILSALANTSAVSLVVQKEDFLRPDLQARPGWSQKLRTAYQALPSFHERYGMGQLIGNLSVGGGQEQVEPVRCVGNYNSDKSPAFPRAHHKFIVFAKYSEGGWEHASDGSISDDDDFEYWQFDELYAPYAVWTGSFNFTDNATKSFENALYLTDSALVQAYYHEYQHLFALSEPLDWEHEWVTPEYRIGT